MPKILAVDDQADMRWFLTHLLREQGFEVVTAEDGEQALERFKQEAPQVVLLDLKMPRLDGMRTLEQIKGTAPEVPVIVITAYGDVPSAVQAMRLGAYDFLTKPFDNEELLYTVKRAVERRELLSQVEDLRTQLKKGGSLGEVMGFSPKIQEVFQQIQQVASSNFTVIIQGETGVGKEIVARAIHQQSSRREGPFIALDCGAIPETLVESELFGYEKGAFTGADRHKLGHVQLAEKGTLFLDEIANLPLVTQSKLLRMLQERHIQPLGGKSPFPLTSVSSRPECELRRGAPGRPVPAGSLSSPQRVHDPHSLPTGAPGGHPTPGEAVPGRDQHRAEEERARVLGGGVSVPPELPMAGQCPRAPERHPAGDPAESGPHQA